MVGVALRSCVFVLAAAVLALACIPFAGAQVAVTTWHYDTFHSGANTTETTLTPQNVNISSFGKLFTQTVDGAIVGQALYMPNLRMPKAGLHNVVFVATMNDSVYAFDADSANGRNANPLWHTSFLSRGATPVPVAQQGCGGTTAWTQIGIVSTPVLDPVKGILYVVAKTYENSTYVHRLHALNVRTGKELARSPLVIKASYQQGNKNFVFQDHMQVNRPALLLLNGMLYIAFGSNGCRSGKEQGWVLAYNAASLQQEGAFDDEPGKSAAAIWQRGGGLSADNEGYIYGATADGPFIPGTNFGQSVIKLSQAGGSLQLSDWFTPFNEAYLDRKDLDMSEPVLVLPDQSGPYLHLEAAVGKEGTIYILNRDNMGHFCSTCANKDTQIVQELTAAAPETGALLYWNSTLYTSPAGAPISAFALSQGVLAATPFAQSKAVAGGHSPIVSSNGTANGVLWQINGTHLDAFNANSLAHLYSSQQAADNRDSLPALPHFANLMVNNGKVYVCANNSLVVFGLL